MTQTAKLTAADGAAYDEFGNSVSISGNTVVVGAVRATVNGNRLEGAAYVFTEPSRGLGEHDPDRQAHRRRRRNERLLRPSGFDHRQHGGRRRRRAEAAYVFTEPAAGWANMTQTARLTASDGAAHEFGYAVSISGNTVVVGTYFGGVVYVFTEPASGWADMTQTAGSRPPMARTSAGPLPISGNTVVGGECYVNNDQGAAYVFAEPGSAWTDMTQTARLVAADGTGNYEFGYAVSISGNTVVVGAPGATAGGTATRGRPMCLRSPPPVGRT